MKRVATAWVVLGIDCSIIAGPFWWKEAAERNCSSDCTIVKVVMTYDDAKAREKKHR